MAKTNLNITDISNDFTSNPVTGDISIKKNIDAIKQSLKNLMLMKRFDKPFDPKIDVGLNEVLFENFPDPILKDIISKKIEYIISVYEPRIKLQKVEVESLYEKNLLQIDITFSLRNQASEELQNLQINLERIR
jgi:predicted component of type VI protein secretion system